MTTIAYRDGVLAADTLCVQGGTIVGHVVKIARNARGDMASATGSQYAASNWLARFCEAEDPLKIEFDFQEKAAGIIILTSGQVWFHEGSASYEAFAPYHTMGSGSDHALTAMDMGASAIEAVQMACLRDTSSAAPIHVARIGVSGIEKIEGEITHANGDARL